MKKKYLILIVLLIVNSSVHAEKFKLEALQNGDGLGVDFEYADFLDKRGNVLLEIEYETNRYDRVEDFGLTDIKGKKGTKIDESNMALYLGHTIDYQNFNFSIDLGYEKFTRDKEQLGYYKKGNNHLPYDHFIKLQGSQINIKGESVYKKKNFYMRLEAILTPQTKLDIEQNTKIFPNNIEDGSLKSDTTLGFSYQLEAEAKWNIVSMYSIGVEGSYGFIPYEYQLKVKKGDSFKEKTQSYDEIRSEYIANFYIETDSAKEKNGFTYYIGYGKNQIKKSGFNILSQNIVKVGIEKWF